MPFFLPAEPISCSSLQRREWLEKRLLEGVSRWQVKLTHLCSPSPTCLHLTHLQASPGVITAVMTTTAKEASCPVCKSPSDKVHSRYFALPVRASSFVEYRWGISNKMSRRVAPPRPDARLVIDRSHPQSSRIPRALPRPIA